MREEATLSAKLLAIRKALSSQRDSNPVEVVLRAISKIDGITDLADLQKVERDNGWRPKGYVSIKSEDETRDLIIQAVESQLRLPILRTTLDYFIKNNR